MDYRADVDGLRAVAVLPVVLFHAGLAPFSGGFAGVNVFFVISGYLITSIIYPQLRDGRFSLATFYQKRADRLFPVLFSVLLAVVVMGFVVSPPMEYQGMLASVFSAATFTSNLYFWHTQDYFSASAMTLPLLHTWSLGVEEQFYIFFPLFLLIACRFRQARAAVALGLVGSFLLSVMAIHYSVSGTFYLLPFRAWELLLGSAIAMGVVPPIRSGRVATLAGFAGLAMLLVTYVLYSKSTLFPAYNALLPTVGAALIIMAGAHPLSPASRLLSNPALVVTGKASYSIYMWHWPIIVFHGLLLGFPMDAAGKWWLVALSLLAGFASWYVIEGATRGRLSGMPARRTAAVSMALFAPVVAFAGYGVVSGGVPERVAPEVVKMEQYRKDFSPHRLRCHQDDDNRREYNGACVLGTADTSPDTVVWGDSHGVEIAAALGERLAEEGRSLRQVTYSACPPAKGVEQPNRRFCVPHNDQTLTAIVNDPAVQNVVLAAYYASHSNDFEQLAKGLENSINALQQAGKRVIVSYPLPETTVDMPMMMARRMMLGNGLPDIESYEDFRADFQQGFELVEELERKTGVIAVPTYQRFCDQRCQMADKNGVYFFDRHHLSMYGARQLTPLYQPWLSASNEDGTHASVAP